MAIQRITVDAFIGSATDREKVCIGNPVGLPAIVVPAGFMPPLTVITLYASVQSVFNIF